MSVPSSGSTARFPRHWRILLIAAVCVVVVGAVIAGVVAVRSNSDDTTVPPLTTAEKQAGAVRVTYPDRSLPNQPTKVVVGGETVSLYFVSANGTGDSATAVLRVASDASPGGTPTEVTLQEAHATSVAGVVVTLLAAYDTGNPSTDAADVTVTEP